MIRVLASRALKWIRQGVMAEEPLAKRIKTEDGEAASVDETPELPVGEIFHLCIINQSLLYF